MQRTPNTVEVTARSGLVLDQVLAEMTALPGGLPARNHEKHGGGTRLPRGQGRVGCKKHGGRSRPPTLVLWCFVLNPHRRSRYPTLL